MIQIKRNIESDNARCQTAVDVENPDIYNEAVNLDNEISHASPVQRLAVSVDEMAHMLSISRPVAYDLARQKNFPSFRIGKRILVNVAGLQRWLDAQSEQSVLEGGYYG